MNKENKKILVSGVKPTGRPHIGNFFGAIKQFVDLQERYDARIFIADYHALTTVHEADQLREDSLGVAMDYLALGLDPSKALLFKQSDVPELTELTWIFNCLTTVPYLERAHAYKDARAKGQEVSVGTFDYPLLMAADILVHDADAVPVGQDQKQHIEYARDIAEKFNRVFGEIFALPESLTLDEMKTVPGTDGQKMSKSYGNTIGLFATDNEIERAVMSIPTDSKSVDEPKDPDESTLVAFHRLFSEGEKFEDIERRFREGGIGYKESKEILIEDVKNFIGPLRERRQEIAAEPEQVKETLEDGGERAREIACEKMKDVRAKTGLSFSSG